MARHSKPIKFQAKHAITNEVKEASKQKGTHPHHYSHHSGSKISNPNVVHYHKIHDNDSKEHITHIHHQSSKLNTHTEDGHNPNQLPHGKIIPAKTGTKAPLHPKTPVGKTPLPNKPTQTPKVPVSKNPPDITNHNPPVKTTAPNITPYNPATSTSIQDQIDANKNAAQQYNNSHRSGTNTSTVTKPGTYTPQTYDYSHSFAQGQPSTQSSNPVFDWIGNQISSFRKWAGLGNPYY